TAVRLAEALGLDGAERAALLAATRRAGPRPPVQPGSRRGAGVSMPLNRFVGREREISEVNGLLDESRLLTLVGSGGVGKTRLALALAEQQQATLATTIAFVDLAGQA